MSTIPRRRGPILGAPLSRLALVERRPESCRDCSPAPRGTRRSGWTLLEGVGALSLTGAWLYVLALGFAELCRIERRLIGCELLDTSDSQEPPR